MEGYAGEAESVRNVDTITMRDDVGDLNCGGEGQAFEREKKRR